MVVTLSRPGVLTHWGWVTHICVSKLTIIGSDNGLLPGKRHTIIWANAGLLSIGPLGTNFSENFEHFHSRKCNRKWRQPFCLGLSVLIPTFLVPALVPRLLYRRCWWRRVRWQLPWNLSLIGHWRIWIQSKFSKFQTHFNNEYLQYFQQNCYQMNATTPC